MESNDEKVYLPFNYTEKTYCIFGPAEQKALRKNEDKTMSKLIVSFSFILIFN